MNRRIVQIIFTALALVTLIGCGILMKTTSSLEGTWTITSASLAGKELPLSVFQNSPLKLIDGMYEFQNDSGDYTLHPDATPAAMDIHGHQGPNAGKTIPAIFELKGDTLRICYDLSGQSRPTRFSSESGSRLFLVRYTRIRM